MWVRSCVGREDPNGGEPIVARREGGDPGLVGAVRAVRAVARMCCIECKAHYYYCCC